MDERLISKRSILDRSSRGVPIDRRIDRRDFAHFLLSLNHVEIVSVVSNAMLESSAVLRRHNRNALSECGMSSRVLHLPTYPLL